MFMSHQYIFQSFPGVLRIANARNQIFLGSLEKSLHSSKLTSIETNNYSSVSFYKFTKFTDQNIHIAIPILKEICESNGIKGSITLSNEGVNGQIAVSQLNISNSLAALSNALNETNLHFNIGQIISAKDKFPFRKLIVRQKKSIISAGKLDNFNLSYETRDIGIELSPDEWHQKLLSLNNNTTMLLDVRNHYESSLGSFIGSTPLNTDVYSDSWDRLDKLVDSSTDMNVMMFCTGGIRCVKASAYLKQIKNLKNVYTLKDGIIGYERWLKLNHSENLFLGDNYIFDRSRSDSVE